MTKRRLNKCYTNEQIKEIIQSHSLYNGNGFIASEALGYPESTVYQYWRSHNLKPQRITHNFTSDEIDIILTTYFANDRSCNKTAQELGYTKNQVNWILKKSNVYGSKKKSS